MKSLSGTQLMKRLLIAFFMLTVPSLAQSIFNCSSFTSGGSGNCNYDNTGASGFWLTGQSTPFAANGQMLLVPFDQGHNAFNMNFHTPVNIQAFTTTLNFSPDGQNIVFVLQNNTNTSCCGSINQFFSAGAGEEAGFFQAFGTVGPGWPNRIVGLKFGMGDFLKQTDSSYTYSSVQLYETGAPPNDPNDGGTFWWPTDKISTSPVPMNLPTSTLQTAYGPRYTASQLGTTLTVTAISSGTLAVGQQAFPIGNPNTNSQIITAQLTGTTGSTGTYTVSASQTVTSTSWWGVDEFSTTITYDGTNLSACLIDLTAANGTCTSGTAGTGTFFTHTWTAVNIPQLVGANTAYVGLSGGINIQPLAGDLIYSWSYTVNSPPSTPSIPTYTTTATYTNGQSPPPTPTASPVAGSYSGTQSVTLASSGSSYICYAVLSSLTSTTILPHADNYQGCAGGGIIQGYYQSGITATGTTGQTCNLASFNGVTGATATVALTGTNTIASNTLMNITAEGTNATAAATSATASSGTATCSGTATVTTTWSGPQQGTKYTGPISVSSNSTIYAQAGYNTSANSSCPGSGGGSTTCAGPPSGMLAANYTISGASTPTFSPTAGSYGSTQSVTISSTSGSVICYNTTGSPATNGTTGCTTGTLYTGVVSVASSETLYAVSGGTGFTDSSVGSAAYTITLPVQRVVIGGKTVIGGNSKH